MKKTVIIILTITLTLALVGCKKTDNTSSESDLSSAPVISSTEENTVSSEDNGLDVNESSSEESNNNSSTVNSSSNANSSKSSTINTLNSTVSQEITKTESSNLSKIINPAYGTVLTINPSESNIQFSNWGWEALTYKYTWNYNDINHYGQWELYFPGTMLSYEEIIEWLKYGDGMLHAPARLGNYEGEMVEYTVWIWLDKETAGPDVDWNYPAYGTVVTEDPRDTHNGGIWGWKQNYQVWIWCSDEQGEYWYNVIYGGDSKEWGKYAASYLEKPNRNGEYVGEKVYKTAWVWLYNND